MGARIVGFIPSISPAILKFIHEVVFKLAKDIDKEKDIIKFTFTRVFVARHQSALEPDASLRDVKKYLMALIEARADNLEFTVVFDREITARQMRLSARELEALGYRSEDGEVWNKDVRLALNDLVVNINSSISME